MGFATVDLAKISGGRVGERQIFPTGRKSGTDDWHLGAIGREPTLRNRWLPGRAMAKVPCDNSPHDEKRTNTDAQHPIAPAMSRNGSGRFDFREVWSSTVIGTMNGGRRGRR